MAEVDKLIRGEGTIQVDSSLGRHESVLVQDIGGVMLFSLSGHVAPRGLESVVSDGVGVFDRDVMKYDIADWIEKRADPAKSLNAQALTDEAIEVGNLLFEYRTGKFEVSQLESEIRTLSAPHADRESAQDFMNAAIAEHGLETVRNDTVLQQRILSEAAASQTRARQLAEAQKEELNRRATARADELDSNSGAKIEEFKESGTPAVKSLISPIRQLVQLELIKPGGNFEGLIDQMTFGPYGPSSKKMSLMILEPLNGVNIPMTYKAAIDLADRIKSYK